MTKQQLAAFDVAFDNCMAKHEEHTWYEAIVEGFKAAMGEGNLKLTEEEAAMCKEFDEARTYHEEEQKVSPPSLRIVKG